MLTYSELIQKIQDLEDRIEELKSKNSSLLEEISKLKSKDDQSQRLYYIEKYLYELSEK